MESVLGLSHFCVGSRIDAPVCASFWIVAIGASVSLAVFILFFVVRAIYLDVRRRRAADLEEARRARVDLDAIAAARWQGDALAGDPENHPDLAVAFRSHIRTVSDANRVASSPIIVPGGIRRS
jgi:hypothetical protein